MAICTVSHPKLWRGLGGAFADVTSPDGNVDGPAVPSGFPELDGCLPGGGWPQRAITEILVDRYGIGELSLLMPALVRLGRQRPIVWIAPPFFPYAPALARRGLDLGRMLFVFPGVFPGVFPDGVGTQRGLAGRNGSDVLWAAEQVLRSTPGTIALAWLGQGRQPDLRRLQLAAESGNAWAVFFRAAAAARQRSPAALRLRLGGRAPNVAVEILKSRGGRPGRLELDLSGRGLE